MDPGTRSQLQSSEPLNNRPSAEHDNDVLSKRKSRVSTFFTSRPSMIIDAAPENQPESRRPNAQAHKRFKALKNIPIAIKSKLNPTYEAIQEQVLTIEEYNPKQATSTPLRVTSSTWYLLNGN